VSSFRVCLLRPRGHLASERFREIAETLHVSPLLLGVDSGFDDCEYGEELAACLPSRRGHGPQRRADQVLPASATAARVAPPLPVGE
jgi:hypothetical protein